MACSEPRWAETAGGRAGRRRRERDAAARESGDGDWRRRAWEAAVQGSWGRTAASAVAVAVAVARARRAGGL